MTVSEKQLNEAFENYCENDNEFASNDVTKSYKDLSNKFDEYIGAIAEDNWKKGFCYALKTINKEV